MNGDLNATGAFRLFLLILFCLIPRSCARGENSKIPQRTELQPASLRVVRNPARVKFEAYRIIDEQTSIADEAWLPDFNRYRLQVLEFYASLDDQLAWVRDSKPTPQAWEIIRILQQADQKGLRPEDYGYCEWNADLQMFYETWDPPRWPIVRFDLALTVYTMRYLSDLHSGRVNPRLVHFQVGPENKRLELASLLLELSESNNVEGEIEKVEPPFPAYRRTLTALNRYLELAKVDAGGSLQLRGKVGRIGDTLEDAAWLAERLQLFGDLRADYKVTVSIYSVELSEGVKRFQQRHGLSPTGILDKKTANALNVPVAQRIKQLNLTLERWRWVLPSFSSPPIVVNIPEFRLHTELSLVAVGESCGRQSLSPSNSSLCQRAQNHCLQTLLERPFLDCQR